MTMLVEPCQYNEEADKDSEIKMIEFFEKKTKTSVKIPPKLRSASIHKLNK